ncbi:hypothetical protein AWB76_00199 [Caballeronia temeraria]|uniref:Uncharacterized protein n=1 Tax=Caballeronia temeraria TaxID=1777137 RepID=A0A157Z5A7_9BURK|nr:hypothetical protein [Caballeronia temeraria]SAK40694.1 hypothetical protein AWB76_00199 [Caballeronia temeraria]
MTTKTPTNETNTMSAKERDSLREVVRLNGRVAKTAIDEYAATLRARMEENLSKIFDEDDERWSELVAHAKQVGHEADEKLKAIAKASGIPMENAPGFMCGFINRGRYGLRERRDEVRKAGNAEIDARVKKARAQLERALAAKHTELLAGSLTSETAKAALAAMPTPEQLLPPLKKRDIAGLLSGHPTALMLSVESVNDWEEGY